MALRPHHRALLAIVRAQPEPEYPLGSVLYLGRDERAALLDILRRNGLGGWAHVVLRQAGLALPADLALPLAAAHRQTMVAAILALDAYGKLSRALSAAGVEHVPLKGARFLRELYPDPGTREVSDLDVLVRKEDVDRADRALTAQGLRGDDARTRDRQDRFHHHRHYVLPGAVEVTVELHWRLSSAFGLAADPAELWRAARPASGPEATELERRLEPLVELHGLLVHAANHGYAPALKWLVDLRLLLDGELAPEPARLAAVAQASGTAGACGHALALAGHLAGSRAALRLRAALRPAVGTLRAAALDRLARPEVFFGPGRRLTEKWPSYAFQIALADGLGGRARSALRTVGFKSHLEGLLR